MHITFTKTVTPPDAVTTFTAGKTFLMPDAMAQGFIDQGVAVPAKKTDSAPAEQELADTSTDGETATD